MNLSSNIGHALGLYVCIALNSCAHVGLRSCAVNLFGINGGHSGSHFWVVAGDWLFHCFQPWGFALGFLACGVLGLSSNICHAYGSLVALLWLLSTRWCWDIKYEPVLNHLSYFIVGRHCTVRCAATFAMRLAGWLHRFEYLCTRRFEAPCI